MGIVLSRQESARAQYDPNIADRTGRGEVVCGVAAAGAVESANAPRNNLDAGGREHTHASRAAEKELVKYLMHCNLSIVYNICTLYFLGIVSTDSSSTSVLGLIVSAIYLYQPIALLYGASLLFGKLHHLIPTVPPRIQMKDSLMVGAVIAFLCFFMDAFKEFQWMYGDPNDNIGLYIDDGFYEYIDDNTNDDGDDDGNTNQYDDDFDPSGYAIPSSRAYYYLRFFGGLVIFAYFLIVHIKIVMPYNKMDEQAVVPTPPPPQMGNTSQQQQQQQQQQQPWIPQSGYSTHPAPLAMITPVAQSLEYNRPNSTQAAIAQVGVPSQEDPPPYSADLSVAYDPVGDLY